MKNIVSLCVLFLCISFISLSPGCKEDAKPEGITVGDLYGSWIFRTLEFNGKITSDCDSILNKRYDFITLDFYYVHWDFWASASALTLNTSCVDSGNLPNWQKDYHFTLIDSVISCNDELKFKIDNISTLQNIRQLKLKLIYSSIPDVPLDGIYTLWETPTN
jgi:hypothetical protein